jgi:hypothetical protein
MPNTSINQEEIKTRLVALCHLRLRTFYGYGKEDTQKTADIVQYFLNKLKALSQKPDNHRLNEEALECIWNILSFDNSISVERYKTMQSLDSSFRYLGNQLWEILYRDLYDNGIPPSIKDELACQAQDKNAVHLVEANPADDQSPAPTVNQYRNKQSKKPDKRTDISDAFLIAVKELCTSSDFDKKKYDFFNQQNHATYLRNTWSHAKTEGDSNLYKGVKNLLAYDILTSCLLYTSYEMVFERYKKIKKNNS